MYAVVRLSGNFYAKDLDRLSKEDAEDYVGQFTSEGTPVTLCEEVEYAADLFGESIELVY